MGFPVGHRVIIKDFGATANSPPINGFFFAFSVVIECSEIFWVLGVKSFLVGVLGDTVAS